MNEKLIAYLRTRYTVTNLDLTTLVTRYLRENPSGLSEQTAVFKALIVAAA